MKQYNVTGMTCAACSARVEKAVSKVEGVEVCQVNLLTNSMNVEGTASEAAIIKAVVDAGYGASPKGGAASKASGSSGSATADVDSLDNSAETKKLIQRLMVSLVFWLVLMYFSMGHMMWNWPLPKFMEGNHVAMGLLQLLLSVIIMVINQRFFVSGFKSLMHGAPNMDTLVALGAAASFGWSVYALFAMTGAVMAGDQELVMVYMDEFYFESAATILTLITVGKTLESYSKGRTTDALKSLMKLAPKSATIVRDGVEVTVPIEEVAVSDIFVVRPGESIPVDGIVVEGVSAVNESALTGESIPVDKEAGQKVSAATINTSGFLKCQATNVGADTALSKIIQMVSDAAATKAPIAKIADKVSGVFVPTVLGLALITLIVWLCVGQEASFALARAISVLVISCPCALGLATPVAIMVGNGVGARKGILFKNAVALENAGRIQIIALDKTGTITSGEPVVTDLIPAEGVSEEELLQMAASLEAKSEHPLAKAIMRHFEETGESPLEVSDFKVLAGNGLTAILEAGEIKTTLTGGSVKFMRSRLENTYEGAHEHMGKAVIPELLLNKAEQLSSEGKTPMLFAADDKCLGLIAVADAIKEDAKDAIGQLKGMGIRVVMLTGDNERTAKAIAGQAGIEEVISDVLPDGKEAVIRDLKESGRVAMVGDGINDAPALTRADIGIAIGAGTDVAIDAADIVLMKSNLIDVPAAIRLSRGTLRNIKQNLFWAFFYNVIGIPLSAGVYYSLWGWKLNPMFGAAAMSLSSFCVVMNALRLNLISVYNAKHDWKIKQNAMSAASLADATDKEDTNSKNTEDKDIKMEGKKMTKTMNIEGMMCMHCEARVKKTLEAIEGVAEAVVSHEAGTAVVTLTADVADDVLQAAVEAQDYKVTGIA